MKKIIIALMALLITFGLLGIGTYGIFAYPEEDNNSISDETLTLDIQRNNVANEAYTFTNIKPGDSGGWDGSQGQFDEMTWTVKNTGTVDGTLEVSIENIVDNGGALSTQIRPKMIADGFPVRESLNLKTLPAYQRYLPSGEEVTIDIAWKFYDSAGNEYQGAITKFNVKFYISASSPDTGAPILDIPTVTPPTPFLEVAAITESFIEVLAFTGLNLIIPIGGFILLIAGTTMLIIAMKRKRITRIEK